jgi:hypothetical protein
MPFGYTIFCDEIRDDPTGKVTCAGIYGHVLFAPSEFPFTLSKVALLVRYVAPFSSERERADIPTELELQIYFPGDGDTMPTVTRKVAPLIKPLPFELSDLEDKQMVIEVRVELAQMRILTEGAIKVRIRAGSDITKVGQLRIGKAPVAALGDATLVTQSLTALHQRHPLMGEAEAEQKALSHNKKQPAPAAGELPSQDRLREDYLVD